MFVTTHLFTSSRREIQKRQQVREVELGIKHQVAVKVTHRTKPAFNLQRFLRLAQPEGAARRADMSSGTLAKKKKNRSNIQRKAARSV